VTHQLSVLEYGTLDASYGTAQGLVLEGVDALFDGHFPGLGESRIVTLPVIGGRGMNTSDPAGH